MHLLKKCVLPPVIVFFIVAGSDRSQPAHRLLQEIIPPRLGPPAAIKLAERDKASAPVARCYLAVTKEWEAVEADLEGKHQGRRNIAMKWTLFF